MNRLYHLPTLRVNPSEKLTLHYRKKICDGIGGDTVATALFANGVRIFGRSLKYHRPRGLYSLDGECSNTCMAVNGIPNVRTETTLLKPDMHVHAQNVQGAADHDLMGFMDKLDWLMPAGFYYRTMHKPAAMWPVAMKQIRKAAGLGTLAPDFNMTGVYDEIYPKTDICIVGGGAAGMMAALAAAETGKRVIVLEARPWLGGCFDYRTAAYSADKALYERARELADQVQNSPNIRVFTHTPLIGAYSNNLITAFQVGKPGDAFDERYVEIRAESVVVATGCI
ncbi:MAG: FAD-dependent oxidoreductase, partial [Desulfatirhabdiaceae bacterium]